MDLAHGLCPRFWTLPGTTVNFTLCEIPSWTLVTWKYIKCGLYPEGPIVLLKRLTYEQNHRWCNGKVFQGHRERKKASELLTDDLVEGETGLLRFFLFWNNLFSSINSKLQILKWSFATQPNQELRISYKYEAFLLLAAGFIFSFFSPVIFFREKVKEVKIIFESGFSKCWPCSKDDKILFFKSILSEHQETYLTLTAGEKNEQQQKRK